MLTGAQKNFLRKTGVNQTMANLLGNVRFRRENRKHAAEVLTHYRNYQRTKNTYNTLSKKELNLNTNLKNQNSRLYRSLSAHRANLFRGAGNLTRATIRNRIQTLPRNVPKTINMKEFVRRLNAYEALRPTVNSSRAAYLTAMRKFIRIYGPLDQNISGLTLEQLDEYAKLLSRELKYNKGRVIGKVVGNRATNPHTVVGHRMIMKGYPGN